MFLIAQVLTTFPTKLTMKKKIKNSELDNVVSNYITKDVLENMSK
jgi:hypothetical protein